MRTFLVAVTGLVTTPLSATIVIIAALLRVPDREGSVFDRTLRFWAKSLIWAAGVELVVHGGENRRGARHIFVANHISWCDIPALATVLTRFKFVAKAELQRIPLFGAAVRAIGSVYIDRQNRSSSFESLRKAAEKIHEGASVVIFAEGTRGTTYALRPFKKGAFVLAINAEAPIVPVVIHGAIEVLPRTGFRVQAGRVNVHFLEPVSTAGMTYDNRNALAATVYARMAALLASTYGVQSPPWTPIRHDA
jgi:1-acyl-sn-glycerol-3-phosphate acyltransferase